MLFNVSRFPANVAVFMKPLRLQLALLVFITTMTLGCSTVAMAAPNCAYLTALNPESLNFGANLTSDNLTISADTANNTVVYRDTVSGKFTAWWCDRTYKLGVVLNPTLGTALPGGTIFPLGRSGLSFRITLSLFGNPAYIPGADSWPSSPNFKNTFIKEGDVTLEIIKTGTLTKKIKIDAGHLADMKADDLILKQFNLANPIVFNTASCQTPSVPVDMGSDYDLNDFPTTGPTQRTVHFNIALNECQGDISKVTYSLKANTEVIDAQKGIVALSKGLKSAQGIGLQLLDDTGQPIALGTPYTFNGFTASGTSFNIPLSATYYRLPTGELKAGKGNTDVTFIANYL